MSDNLWVQETYLNATEGHGFGESDVYETYTDSRGELFRDMQKEFGRCVSKMYIDTADGVKTIGWVFQKTMVYEDSRSGKDTYLREVWVAIHTAPPTRTVQYHYAEAGA